MSDAMTVFDRRTVRRHRDRAAPRLAEHDFLLREVSERLVDRLDDIRRAFPLTLDLGCHDGAVGRALAGRGGIDMLVQSDLSPAMAASAQGLRVTCDEEALPFANSTFDAVLSVLSLHWVNDLPGALVQIRRSLKPDGLFLAAMLGGETLKELRAALGQADLSVEGGTGPRVSPFTDVRDAGALLQRAGFALPVVDTETIIVNYRNPMTLLYDLRGMGQTNAVVERRKSWSRRTTLLEAAARYVQAHPGIEAVPATFQVLYLTAWSPHERQQKPLRPGSAAARLADALGSAEIPGGETVPRMPGSER